MQLKRNYISTTDLERNSIFVCINLWSTISERIKTFPMIVFAISGIVFVQLLFV